MVMKKDRITRNQIKPVFIKAKPHLRSISKVFVLLGACMVHFYPFVSASADEIFFSKRETAVPFSRSPWRVYLDAGGEIMLDSDADGSPDQFVQQHIAEEAANAYLRANDGGVVFTGLCGLVLFRHTINNSIVFVPDGPDAVVPEPTPGAAEINLIDSTSKSFWTRLYRLAEKGPVNVFIPAGTTIAWGDPQALPDTQHRIWIGCDGGTASVRTSKGFAFYNSAANPRGSFAIVNLDIRPAVTGAAFAGLRLFGVDGLTLYGCTVADYGGTNIILQDGITDVLIDRCRILDARSVSTYKQGLYASGVEGLHIRDTVFDRNGVMDAEGNTTSLSNLMRAHNLYCSSGVTGLKLERVVSTRSAGIGAKIQATDYELIDCVFAYNPIGFNIGQDGRGTSARASTGTLNRVAVIDGTDYPTSNRNKGATFNSIKNATVRGLIIGRVRQPLYVITEAELGIALLTIEDSTIRGHLLAYWTGKQSQSVVFRRNRFQYTAGLSPASDLFYADGPGDPAGATFDGNAWFAPKDMSYTVQDESGTHRMTFEGFNLYTGGTDRWERHNAENPDAGLESFTGKDKADAIADVRAGEIDAADLYQHIAEGLR